MSFMTESKRKRSLNVQTQNPYIANSISTNEDEMDSDEEFEDNEDNCSSSAVSCSDQNYSNCQAGSKARRKQNKPIRISSQQNQSTTKPTTQQQQIQQQLELEAQQQEQKQKTEQESKQKEFQTTQQQQNAKLTCGFCSLLCTNLNDLKNHLYKDHIEEILQHLANPSQTNQSNNKSTKAMESFCTICKKEVCNKYFLKSHLLNKHGVQLEDYLAAQNASSSSSIQGGGGTNGGQNSALLAAAVANELIENHAQTLNLQTLNQVVASKYMFGSADYLLMSKMNSSKNLVNTEADSDESASLFNHYLSLAMRQPSDLVALNQPSGDFCDICQKQFCNKYYLKKHKLDVHGVHMDTTSTCLNTSQAKIQKEEISTPPLKVAQTEIEEQKVKCDICNKVFFNKEYLLLHKQNKHEKPFISNLTNNKENRLTSSLATKTDSPNILTNEAFCEYCNKSFCNKYFLRTHMAKAHGKTLIIENNTNNTMISSLINNEQNSNNAEFEDSELNLNETYFASKIVDRVQCDICNKQVCNKYFLRTHKQKVHGIYDSISQRQTRNSGDDNNMEEEEDELDQEEEEYEFGMENEEEGEIIHFEEEEKELGEVESKKRRCSSSSVNSSSNMSVLSTSSSSLKKESNTNTNAFVPSSSSSLTSHAPTSPSKQENTTTTTTITTNCFLTQLDLQNSYCSMCKRKFYSYNFLRNHMNKIHSIKLPKRSLNGGLEDDKEDEIKVPTTSEELDEEYQQEHLETTPQTTTSLPKLNELNLLLVECKLCLKEFLNKPLLKQHVLISHKMKFTDYLAKYPINLENSLKKSVEVSSQEENNSSLNRKRKNSADSESSSVCKKSRASSQSSDQEQLEEEEEESSLQAFMLEKDDSDAGDNWFAPCLVYLPVKAKVNAPISLRIKLKPIEDRTDKKATSKLEQILGNIKREQNLV